MERKFGVPLTTGYFSFVMDTEDDSPTAALDRAYEFVMGETGIYGSFNMPACPSHKHAQMRLNPAHVVGVVELP